jgi:hypothetical protein
MMCGDCRHCPRGSDEWEEECDSSHHPAESCSDVYPGGAEPVLSGST